MTRVLVAEHPLLDLHQLRTESRRSGLVMQFDVAAGREEFFRLLRGRLPGVILTTPEALDGLPLPELTAAAHGAGASVMVLGGREQPAHREQKAALHAGADATCRVTSVSTLPLLLERLALRRAEYRERTRERERAHEQLEQAAEQVRDLHKLATIGQQMGTIVHEINNPLESVTNLLYLLNSDSGLPEPMRPYVQLAQQELDRVSLISKQTLSFFRESQAPERVLLSDLLEEVLVLYSRRLSDKQISLERRLASEEPVLAFPGEMRQVLANLIGNAIEATDRYGRIVVSVHPTRLRAGENETFGMRVTVADSGSGITPDALARLGQPFFTTKGQKGTGLGLWVSKNILEGYGGSMRLRSSTDPRRHGTTFSLFMPIELRPRLVEGIRRIAAVADEGTDEVARLANGS